MNERAPDQPDKPASTESGKIERICAAAGLTADEIHVVASRQDRDAFAAKMTGSSVRMLRGLLASEEWSVVLEESEGELFRMADESREKIQPLVDAGIMEPGTVWVGDFVSLCELDDFARKNIVRAAEVAGIGVARGLMTSGMAERVDFDGPEGEALRAILAVSPRVFLSEWELSNILSKDDPAAWIRGRAALMEPLRSVFDYFELWRWDAAMLGGNDLFLRTLAEGPWSDGAKALAVVEYGYREFGTSDQADIGQLRTRLDFWSAHVSPDVLSSEAADEIRELLVSDLLFLRTMREMLTDEEWKSATSHKENAAYFKRLEIFAKAFSPTSATEFASFAAREAIPVEAEPGGERLAEELRDVLVASGLEPMTRTVSSKLRATAPSAGWSSGGSYDPSTGQVWVGAKLGRNKDLLGILFHETGHGVQYLLATSEAGKALNARFAVAAALEPQTHSSYAESFRIREKDPRVFVLESFAADFLLFFFAPERLPARKRETLEHVVATQFPAIDPEGVRRRVRSVLGNFYGVAVNDVIFETSCENARDLARHMDRMDAEDERDEKAAEE